MCEIVKNPHKVGHKNDLNYKITMNGCGQLTSWIFPDTTMCPNGSCKRKFNNRSETMTHFRDQHAKDSILCKICQKPISTKSSHEFARHYKRLHPNLKVPYNFDKPESPRRSTQVCQTQINTKKSKNLNEFEIFFRLRKRLVCMYSPKSKSY